MSNSYLASLEEKNKQQNSKVPQETQKKTIGHSSNVKQENYTFAAFYKYTRTWGAPNHLFVMTFL